MNVEVGIVLEMKYKGEDIQKIVDANEKIIKEIKDNAIYGK